MRDDTTHPADSEPTYSEFSDPRLVGIYDTVNPIGEYAPFYLDLAAKLAAATIVDVGCGTGLLTYELAKRGHRMIGVEPAPAMLDIARRRLRGMDVRWIAGYADRLGNEYADLAIMTGHVAQFFLDDESWHEALTSIHRALRAGGHLAFESRNPRIPPFASWPTAAAHRTVRDPVARDVEWWWNRLNVSSGYVRYDIHYLFKKSGDEIVSLHELIFRSEDELRQSLERAGFSVERVHGDWDGSPATAESRELIFVARRCP